MLGLRLLRRELARRDLRGDVEVGIGARVDRAGAEAAGLLAGIQGRDGIQIGGGGAAGRQDGQGGGGKAAQ